MILRFFNKTPLIIDLDDLIENGDYRVEKEINDKWVRARPIMKPCELKHRFKCAWLAFTGKCDLVKWPEGQ